MAALEIQLPDHRPLIELAEVSVPSALDPGVSVMDGVNWSIERGQFWVVGGPPNSGKSDLLATAAGLTRPLRGRCRLWGKEPGRMRGEELLQERLRIGLVFAEGGRLFTHLTVAENVALPWCYHHNCVLEDAVERVTALLERLGLSFLTQQSCARLGRSWRQRIALARALVLDPEVLFVDNPLAETNYRQADWWLDFLTCLAQPGAGDGPSSRTVVVSTDRMRPWLSRGRQFGVIHQRQWRVVGGAERIETSQTPGLRDLLAESSGTIV